MSLIRKHVAVLQAWACLALVLVYGLVINATSCLEICKPV